MTDINCLLSFVSYSHMGKVCTCVICTLSKYTKQVFLTSKIDFFLGGAISLWTCQTSPGKVL